MLFSRGIYIFEATDLTLELACPHDLANLHGFLKRGEKNKLLTVN